MPADNLRDLAEAIRPCSVHNPNEALRLTASDAMRDAADEIERLRAGLEAVTAFHQVTHCHAAARAALAGMPVGTQDT